MEGYIPRSSASVLLSMENDRVDGEAPVGLVAISGDFDSGAPFRRCLVDDAIIKRLDLGKREA